MVRAKIPTDVEVQMHKDNGKTVDPQVEVRKRMIETFLDRAHAKCSQAPALRLTQPVHPASGQESVKSLFNEHPKLETSDSLLLENSFVF